MVDTQALPAAESRSRPTLGEASWYSLWSRGQSFLPVCKLPTPSILEDVLEAVNWGLGRWRRTLPPSCRLQGLCCSSSTRRQGRLWVLSMRLKVLRERLGTWMER